MSRCKVRSCLAVCMLLVLFIFLSMLPSFAQNATNNQPAARTSSTLATPQVGKELYSDDFSSSKSGWPIYSSGDILAGYKKGIYHVTIVPEDYWKGILAPNLNLSDFIVEVEATKEAGPDDNAYGIWIRNLAPGSLYTFMISSDGYFQLVEKENGTWITPSNWTKSSAIKTGNETNLIKVVAKGDEFAFYANDVLLSNYSNDSFAYGGLGLWTGSQSEGNVTIGFDNFKVWAIKD